MNRELWLDILRGIGILLVVLGHTTALPPAVQTFIYSFHLPLFFYLSGYLFNAEKYKQLEILKFASARFRRLMVPYFVMALICLLFVLLKDLKNQVLQFEVLTRYVEGIVYSRGSVSSMPSCSPLWFLSCLYVIECLFFTVIKMFSGKARVFFAVAALGLIGAVLSMNQIPKLFWNFDTALTGIVFYYCGHMTKIMGGGQYLKYPYVLILIILNFVSVQFNSIQHVDFDGNRFGNIILMYLGAFSGIGISLIFAKIISRISLPRIQNFFIFWGTNTLPVIGFDYLTLNILNSILAKFQLGHLYFLNFCIHLVMLFVLIRLLKINNLVCRLVYGLI